MLRSKTSDPNAIGGASASGWPNDHGRHLRREEAFRCRRRKGLRDHIDSQKTVGRDLTSLPRPRATARRLEALEVVTVGTLTTAIADWDGDHTQTEPPTATRTVETALRHVHLPKLSDADTDAIEPGETDGITPLLEDTARIDGYVRTAPSN
ncbi:DUF7344 domain-containing protein [Natrinema zhouii]|uniref:DUF7344 domain-containing protein n=1 Tax=Natrinema zhouii TaxID=1710539 RepID=UPI003CE58EFE